MLRDDMLTTMQVHDECYIESRTLGGEFDLQGKARSHIDSRFKFGVYHVGGLDMNFAV